MLLDFIISNYINILLIIGLILAIFITQSFKKLYGIFLLILSAVSLIFLFFIYYQSIGDFSSDISLLKNVLIILFIIQPIEFFLYTLSYININKKNIIMAAIPCLINLIVMAISFNNNYVVGVVGNTLKLGSMFYFELCVCFIYLLNSIIIGIIDITKNRISDGLILVLSSIVNVFALLIGVDKMTFDISNSTILFSGVLIFINCYTKEQAHKSADQEKMIQEQRTALTISQIQPHFLYNSLATIGYICKKDPIKASQAIDQFSDYLRANLNSIKKKENVPFLEELKHIKTYVSLEKLRFEDRLKVIYDIPYTDFLVPSLSIQPLVENAIKHGICNKIEGGRVIIRTVDYLECIKVVIEDDGVGFDSNVNLNDGKTHVGIENVRSRLKSMSDATLEIQSKVGKGTTATITFKKERS